MAAYAYYKLRKLLFHSDKFSMSLVVIDEGLHCATNSARFSKLTLMIRIHERDIYEAFHLMTRLKAEPELRVVMKFIEGIIELMRRNYQEGIDTLLTIQHELGFQL